MVPAMSAIFETAAFRPGRNLLQSFANALYVSHLESLCKTRGADAVMQSVLTQGVSCCTQDMSIFKTHAAVSVQH